MDHQFSPIQAILKNPAFQDFESPKVQSIPPVSHTESVDLSPQKVVYQDKQALVYEKITTAIDALQQLLILLSNESHAPKQSNAVIQKHELDIDQLEPLSGTIIEGVFDGARMIDADGHQYFVPPNYASKSKLVEGDLLKLTITSRGAYVYKQISATDRRRVRGELTYNTETKQYGIHAEGKLYNILKESVTFYKGKPGDEVVFLVPADGTSSWGAVEHIINATQSFTRAPTL